MGHVSRKEDGVKKDVGSGEMILRCCYTHTNMLCPLLTNLMIVEDRLSGQPNETSLSTDLGSDFVVGQAWNAGC